MNDDQCNAPSPKPDTPGMDLHLPDLEQLVRHYERENRTLRDAMCLARYEIDAVRKSALAADDLLRRAAVQIQDEDDPLNWIC